MHDDIGIHIVGDAMMKEKYLAIFVL